MLHYLTQDTCKGDGSVIGSRGFVTFLEKRCHISRCPITGDNVILEGYLKEDFQYGGKFLSEFFQNHRFNLVRACCLSGIEIFLTTSESQLLKVGFLA